MSKERLEVFSSGRILHLDNFRKLTGYGWPGFKTMRLGRQDKGQSACAAAFIDAIAKGDASDLISTTELLEVAQATLQVANSVDS